MGSSDKALLADAGSPRLMDNAVVLLQPPTPGLLDRVLRLARRLVIGRARRLPGVRVGARSGRFLPLLRITVRAAARR
jgi:hypothetical protein